MTAKTRNDTHVYLTPELTERLLDYTYEMSKKCKKTISQSEIIRRALDDYLPRLKKPGK